MHDAPSAGRKRQRITEAIWWYRHTGAHSAETLRLGKQTLCQLSYSRSGVTLKYSVCLSAKGILGHRSTLQRSDSVCLRLPGGCGHMHKRTKSV